MRDDLHQGRRSKPGMAVVAAAGQRNRHPRPENDARRQCIAEQGELLRNHVARFEIGGEEDVRLAGYGRAETGVLGGFERYCVIDGQWTVEDATRNLAALGHLAERRRFDRGGHLRIDHFPGREHGHFRGWVSEPARKIDRILADLAFLRKPGRDVDHCVGDEQRLGIRRHVQRVHMADAALRAQAFRRRDDLTDEVLGRHVPLDDTFDPAFACKADGHRNRLPRVRRWHDLERIEIDAARFGDFANQTFRADEDRHDDAVFDCGRHCGERTGVARTEDRCRDGRKLARLDPAHDLAEPHILVVEMHRGKVDLGTSHLFARGNHFGRARNDDFAILVRALGSEYHLAFGVLLLCRDFDGDRVADLYRTTEAQLLAKVDRTGPREGRPEDRGDERATPHAVSDYLAETAARCIFRIDMRWIDVARHNCEQRDVLFGERALERGSIADFDFIEGAILDELHLNPRNGWCGTMVRGNPAGTHVNRPLAVAEIDADQKTAPPCRHPARIVRVHFDMLARRPPLVSAAWRETGSRG